MEENKLNEEEIETVAGGGKTIDYIAEQGKKVITVLADAIDDLIKKD